MVSNDLPCWLSTFTVFKSDRQKGLIFGGILGHVILAFFLVLGNFSCVLYVFHDPSVV